MTRGILAAPLALALLAAPAAAQGRGMAQAQADAFTAATASRGLSAPPHIPGAPMPRLLQGTAALTLAKGASHAPTTAGTPTRSAKVEAYTPSAAPSALAQGPSGSRHLPVAGAPLAGTAPKMLSAPAGAAHVPATKAKP